jgi:hypothetical protein
MDLHPVISPMYAGLPRGGARPDLASIASPEARVGPNHPGQYN